MVNAKTNIPRVARPTERFVTGESCGNWIFPNKYNAKAPNTAIQIARKTSRSNQWACNTKSALDRNLKANANSRNPKNTFTVLSHPPDFGREFIQPGKAANKPKGNAKANEKPNIPTNGAIPPREAASTNKVPIIGPVQEKETMASARAIKKMPMMPPRSACLSTLFAQEFGSMISKAPKNERPKINSIKKNITLNQTFVESAFNESAPKMVVTIAPKNT